MASIRDVAKRAGVSIATVSAVMTGKRPVSAELRARVEKALKELDYRPNALARALYEKRSRTIAFLVPSIANPGFSKALQQVEKAADERGYAVFVANTEGLERRVEACQHRLLDMRVDGVLIALTWELAKPEVVETFHRHKVEVVGLSGGRILDSIDCYLGNEERAGEDIGRYLINLGHRRIAFIGPERSHVGTSRLQGLQKAMEEAGIETPADMFFATSSYGRADGYEAALNLLATPGAYSAIVVFNDLMASGVLAALYSQGLQVPNHLSVATFGDEYAQVTTPNLTTMVYNEGLAGWMATQRLLDRIEGICTAPPETHLQTMKLVIRGSTRLAEGTPLSSPSP